MRTVGGSQLRVLGRDAGEGRHSCGSVGGGGRCVAAVPLLGGGDSLDGNQLCLAAKLDWQDLQTLAIMNLSSTLKLLLACALPKHCWAFDLQFAEVM